MIPVAFIFPGQGAQTVGMGKELYENSVATQNIFDVADIIIPSLRDVIFHGPEEDLMNTAYCQPAVVTVSLAALQVFKESDKFKKCDVQYVLGHSLGEYSALCASGALNMEDTLKLVKSRGMYMNEAARQCKGSMAAVIGLEPEIIRGVCRAVKVDVANYNSPDQTVISGEAERINAALPMLEEKGAKRIVPLSVSGAFHSSLMRLAAYKFKGAIVHYELENARIPIIGNVRGKPLTRVNDITKELVEQIYSSVNWVKCIEYLMLKRIDTFIEFGPGTILKGLMRKINKDLKVYNVQKPEDIDKIDF